MPSAAPRPFLGRPEFLTALRARRERVVRGEGAVTVLEGEPGVGKSTLITQFLAECQRAGDRVLFARAHRSADAPPLQWIREALGGRDPTRAGEEPVELPGTPRDRIAELLRSLGAPSEPLRPAGFAPLAETFFELAAGAPTVLALENLGSADALSLQFLSYLTESTGSHRLWIIVTGPPVGDLGAPARQFLESLPRSGSVDRLVLRPLLPGELAEFVRWVDPKRAVRPAELTLWFTQTSGNPLFLEQLLRASRRSTPSLWEESRDAGRPFPEFVLDRLGELPEEERRVLAMASVLGGEFPFDLLEATTGMEEERLSEILERLIERGLLAEAPFELVEFARGDLRDLVYATLPEADRRELHQRVARALESTERGDSDALFSIAHHAFFGRLDHLAVEANRKAAQLAARAASPDIARTHLERAIECHRRDDPGGRTVELELVLELAIVLDRLGALDRAEAILREALSAGAELTPPGGGSAELVPIYLARVLTDQGRWEEARTLTDELIDRVERAGSPAARLALHRLRGEIEYFRGDYPEAIRSQDRALEIARAEGDSREVALATVRRAGALAMMPDCLAEAIPSYRQASEELLRGGDRAEAAYALLSLGMTLALNGRADEGLKEIETAASLAEESSDLRQLGWALFAIADLRRGRGELASARKENARAREILGRIGDQFGLAQTHLVGGKIALAEGGIAEAEGELLEAFRLVRRLRTEHEEIEVLLRLAEVAIVRGDRALAAERVRELSGRPFDRLRPDLAGEVRRLVAAMSEGGDAHDGAAA
ncbi:MAG: ATP-binding protein [Thermoplasmata archaeon]